MVFSYPILNFTTNTALTTLICSNNGLTNLNTTSTFRYVEYLEEIDKLKVPSNLLIDKKIFDCIRPPIV
jgi:hypothetical protein